MHLCAQVIERQPFETLSFMKLKFKYFNDRYPFKNNIYILVVTIDENVSLPYLT